MVKNREIRKKSYLQIALPKNTPLNRLF